MTNINVKQDRSSLAVYIIIFLILIIGIISNALFLYKKWSDEDLQKMPMFMLIGVSLLYMVLLDVNEIFAKHMHVILSCISAVLYIVAILSLLTKSLTEYQIMINNIGLVFECLVLFALLITNYLMKINTGIMGFVVAVLCSLAFVVLHVLIVLQNDYLRKSWEIWVSTAVIFLLFFVSVYDLFSYDGVLLWVFLFIGFTLCSSFYHIWVLSKLQDCYTQALPVFVFDVLKVDGIMLLSLLYVSIVLNGTKSIMLHVVIVILAVLQEISKHYERNSSEHNASVNPYITEELTDEEKAKLHDRVKQNWHTTIEYHSTNDYA